MTGQRRKTTNRTGRGKPRFGRRPRRATPQRVRFRAPFMAAYLPGRRARRILSVVLLGGMTIFAMALVAARLGTLPVEEAPEPSPPSGDSGGVVGRRVMPVAPPPTATPSATPRLTTPEATALPVWRRYAAAAPGAGDGRPRIVLVLDDLGLNPADSRRVARLPGPLTLAFLPYADGLQAQADLARAAGHELLVHLPMAADNGSADPGPMALLDGLDGAGLERRLAWNLDRFTGFVGVNNHMGSRLTRQDAPMRLVMATLARRGLLFLDSRTTSGTVAARIAAESGVPVASRDVFIDNDPTPTSVRGQLALLEGIARREGLAIGIGHPHDGTLEALEAWLPGLSRRGIALAPLSAAVSLPERRRAAVSP